MSTLSFLTSHSIDWFHIAVIKKKKKDKKEGILLISENEEHLIDLQKNFSNEISTFILETRFKKKEILFDLTQKKELVFTTYVDLTNPLFSNALGYINVIFFLTPRTCKNGMSIIKKIVSCKENKERLIVMDLVDSFSHTIQEYNIRKTQYEQYKDIKITSLKKNK